MAPNTKQIIVSLMRFLDEQRCLDTLSANSKESLKAAIEHLESAYDVSSSDAHHAAVSLEDMFDYFAKRESALPKTNAFDSNGQETFGFHQDSEENIFKSTAVFPGDDELEETFGDEPDETFGDWHSSKYDSEIEVMRGGGEKRSRSSSGASQSFSAIDIQLASQPEPIGIGVDIWALIGSEEFDLNQVIQLREDDISGLYQSSYDAMTEGIRSTEFCHDLVLETDKVHFVYALLSKIIDFVKAKHGLPDNRLKVKSRQEFPVVINREKKSMYSDYSILATDEHGRKFYPISVECKTFSCDEAVKQAAAYAKAAYALNSDGRTVFSVCTTSRHFSFLSYNPDHQTDTRFKGFKLSEEFKFLFPKMGEEKYKQAWLQNHTKVIDILYSIMCNHLNLPILAIPSDSK